MPSPASNQNVDAYVSKARPFALPILHHLRDLVHKGCPAIEETIKWSRPFFLYRGAVLCNMAAFQQHCSFGFWGEEIGVVLKEAGVLGQEGMGSLGRITSLADLPLDTRMVQWIQQGAGFIESGRYTSPIAARRKVVKVKTPELPIPPEFSGALAQHEQAALAFNTLNKSCQREYVQWISEAKRPETRNRRIASALEWIAEGKSRNWKHSTLVSQSK